MAFQDDYRTYADVRDAVIESIIPANEKEQISGVMRSVELALITSTKGTMKVTREGTEVIELYIRYLERFVFKTKELSIEKRQQFFTGLVECSQCKGFRFVNQQVKRKRVPVQCPKCKGKGTVEKEIECGKA